MKHLLFDILILIACLLLAARLAKILDTQDIHPNVKHGSHTDIEYPTVHPVVHQNQNSLLVKRQTDNTTPGQQQRRNRRKHR